MDENNEGIKVVSKIKTVRLIDWVILLVCLGVVIYCFYTLSHLNTIEDKAVNKCNEFWLEEFAKDCQNDLIKSKLKNNPEAFIYTPPK